jgi:hypothetical protein
MADLSMKELRALAKEAGIATPVGTSKADIEEALAAHEGATSHEQGSDEVVVPEGVVAGETPGWPVDADGNSLELTPEEREKLAAAEIKPPKPASKSGGERRPIEHFSARGDWEDPFSGLMVYYGNDICTQSGARREGDEAVIAHAAR